MSNVDMLGRRLDAEGCVIAGTQLETAARDLKEKDDIVLVVEVQAGVDRVVSVTGTLQELCPSARGDADMFRFDRLTDRNLAAFVRALKAAEVAFEANDMIPPTEQEQALGQMATEARQAIVPRGTRFLMLPFQLQWVRLEEVAGGINKQQHALQTLGLWNQAQRTLLFIKDYGKRLGMTDSSSDSKDKIAAAIMEWHEAWADLAVDVRSTYRDGRQPRAKHVRELLLGAYDRQVERLREEDRKRRSRKGSDTDAEDDED